MRSTSIRKVEDIQRTPRKLWNIISLGFGRYVENKKTTYFTFTCKGMLKIREGIDIFGIFINDRQRKVFM
jgi:hypothetical protein